jgi:hypothetical protein
MGPGSTPRPGVLAGSHGFDPSVTHVFTKDELLRTIWGFRTLGSNRRKTRYGRTSRSRAGSPLHRHLLATSASDISSGLESAA